MVLNPAMYGHPDSAREWEVVVDDYAASVSSVEQAPASSHGAILTQQSRQRAQPYSPERPSTKAEVAKPPAFREDGPPASSKARPVAPVAKLSEVVAAVPAPPTQVCPGCQRTRPLTISCRWCHTYLCSELCVARNHVVLHGCTRADNASVKKVMEWLGGVQGFEFPEGFEVTGNVKRSWDTIDIEYD